MVSADALLMTVKPRLEAFLKPADAREAATLLKALLKEFATDALRVLKSQTERANEEKALLSEQLDRSQRECAEAKREWHEQVECERRKAREEEARLQTKLQESLSAVEQLKALAAANAAAAAAEAISSKAECEATQKRRIVERAMDAVRWRQATRRHAAVMTARLHQAKAEASATLTTVVASLQEADAKLGPALREHALMTEELRAAIAGRQRTAAMLRERMATDQAKASQSARVQREEKDREIAELTREIERLHGVTQQVLKRKETPDAAIELLYYESLKLPPKQSSASRWASYVPARLGPAAPPLTAGGPQKGARAQLSPRALRHLSHRANDVQQSLGNETWQAGRWEGL